MSRQILKSKLLRDNFRSTKDLYGALSEQQTTALRELTIALHLSVSRRELIWLDRQWYVSHSGLLRIAHLKRCAGIETRVEADMTDASLRRWVFRATVHKTPNQLFVGYGDADPSNVSPLVRGAEMRVAETRAVNRALRKAYGIGICSIDEIGSSIPPTAERLPPQNANGNGNGNGAGATTRVRDRLCQVIRQHQLDPELVKAYAIDYCGTKTLREATRQQVENFVQELAEWAEKDRNALLCQLNSYAQPKQEGAA